ncbi:MAG: ATP-binding cassette domain-containing protein [Anaerolineaceae bacterium]|nr:MAG: ATP-binding cassette domain-containing protein [Anaerolineaceae bacterium]
MPAILEVDQLVKKYGDFEAVKGISFNVDEGEVFGLLGPNGAGKTQTISMLTGVIPPTSGTARIAGHDIRTEMNEAKKINGLVPQDLALYPTLSARANLNFFGRIYGLGGKDLKERVEDVLRIVALTERADEAVEKYSGGMKRRVNIAAGLLHHPRLLFLDEPTVGVDPQSRNHIFESVMRLNRERGMSIVYTSHYMEEVELLCNRVAIIDEGKIIALDTIKNLIALLGGGVIHVGLERVDDGLLERLSALPGVEEAVLMPQPAPPPLAEQEDPEVKEREPVTTTPIIKVVAVNSQQAIVNVIGFLNEQDITLTSLEILEPNLESVFLHLTGKKLRE